MIQRTSFSIYIKLEGILFFCLYLPMFLSICNCYCWFNFTKVSTFLEIWQSLSWNWKEFKFCVFCLFFEISKNHMLSTGSNQGATKLELVINSIKSCRSVVWISNEVCEKAHRIRHKKKLNSNASFVTCSCYGHVTFVSS